jgi:NADH-quinone oxidoreductase subunit H
VIQVAWDVFSFLVFPGFLFTAVLGLFVSWVDRKVTARLQWRVGPPLAQPVFDMVKLMGKDVILPRGGNHGLFLIAPFIGLFAVSAVSPILWLAFLRGSSFMGDLIVVVYLLMLPSLALMLGALSSGNPLAGLGASREMKLVLSYELPFLVCIAVVIIHSGFGLTIAGVSSSTVVASLSGSLAFVISLLCVQAKLGFVPFDISEAETEIMEGSLIEYSGLPLAVFKLTQAMLFFTLPVFLCAVFLGGLRFHGWQSLWSVLKYAGVLVLLIVIKNTNPRVRVDQSLKFFWRPLTALALASFALSLIGRALDLSWL